MKWVRQGEAVVGAVRLTDGKQGRIVIIGPRHTPKGAVLVLPTSGPAKVTTLELKDALSRLDPQDVVEVLCMQERLFGASGLPTPSIK